MKLEYIVACENSWNEFELCQIKVNVTVGVQKCSPFTTIQTVRSYTSSSLVQARNLIFSMYMYVHLVLIYKIYECCYAREC